MCAPSLCGSPPSTPIIILLLSWGSRGLSHERRAAKGQDPAISTLAPGLAHSGSSVRSLDWPGLQGHGAVH